LEFDNIRMREISGKDTYWDIYAASAEIDKKVSKLYKVTGNILSNNKPSIYIETEHVLLNKDEGTSILSPFYGKTLNKRNRDNFEISALKANWDLNKQLLITKNKSHLWNKEISITAERFYYFTKYKLFKFKPNFQMITTSYNIRADEAVLNNNNDTIIARENVLFEGKNVSGRSEILEYPDTKKEFLLKEDVVISYKETDIYADRVLIVKESNIVEMDGNIRLDHGDIKCISDRASLDKEKEIVLFKNNIRAWKDNKIVSGENIIFDINKKELISTGRTKLIKRSDDQED